MGSTCRLCCNRYTTDFDLNYNLSYQSGTEIINSAIFHSEDDDLIADVGISGSPATISIWFKLVFCLECQWDGYIILFPD